MTDIKLNEEALEAARYEIAKTTVRGCKVENAIRAYLSHAQEDKCLEVEQLASRYYCEAIDRCSREDDLLGAEIKIKLGEFTYEMLQAHCKNSEKFGKHYGIHEALQILQPPEAKK